MKRIFKSKILIGILLFFVLSLTPLFWFPGDSLLLGYDNVYPLNPTEFLKDRIFSWSSVQGFSMDQSGVQGSLIIHFLDSIPQLLGLSPQLSQKVVYSFWFFLILIAPFILVIRLEKYGFIKSNYIKYIFPVLYAFNFYILQAWWVVERTKFSLVVATPLILSIILPMIKTPLSFWRVFKNAIICAIILSILNGGSWAGIPLYGGLFIILTTFYIFYSVFFYLSKDKRNIVYLNLFFIFFVFWFILLNSYTLLPFIFNTLREYHAQLANEGGVSGIIDWTDSLSSFANFSNLLRLQGIPDWYDNISHPYSLIYLKNILFISASFVFPILLFFAFLNKKKDNKVIITLFLCFLVVSLFFTAGTHKPFGFIFEIFMRKIPGFIIFRSAIYKFGYAYWLSSSFIIAFSLSELILLLRNKIKDKNLFVFTKIALPAFVIIGILAYHFPYFKGDFFHYEATSVTSRVTLPTYVFEFSKWWTENGKDNKVLLLPRLNNTWLFEQYKWNYMSLFPVLGNFANEGIIENIASLSNNERNLVDHLYDSINERDFQNIDALTSILGIRFFLIRKDFYYDMPGQKTDNPFTLEKNLLENPKIRKLKTYGEWIIYEYKEPNEMFTVKNNIILSSNYGEIDLNEFPFKKDALLLNADYFQNNPIEYKSYFINPTCLNCELEREEILMAIPRPKVLLDSPLYEFVDLKNRLKIPKNEPIDDKVLRLIGETIKLSGQTEALISESKRDEFVNLAGEKYINTLNKISKELPTVLDQSSNPYHTLFLIDQYLDGENKFFDNLVLTKTTQKSTRIALEKMIYAIDKLTNEIAKYNGNEELDYQKRYKFNVVSPGDYTIKVDLKSLDEFENSHPAASKLLIDDKLVSSSATIENEYLNLGKTSLVRGKHTLALLTPEPKNLFSTGLKEKIAGKTCFSSIVDNFSIDNLYILSFKSKNNFDPNFFFFIDENKFFSPTYLNFLPIAGEQIKNNRITISSKRISLDPASKKLRVSFCAPSLNEELYKENIKDLSIIRLTKPQVILSEEKSKENIPLPKVNFNRIDKNHYRVFIENAESPFYLVFNQRYASGWQSEYGKHLMGDQYNNVWFIEKKGNYMMDIFYNPQNYFQKGLIISLISLFISLIFLFKKGKSI